MSNIQDVTNIMLFTFVKSSFSQLISGAYCTRPRIRAKSVARTPAVNQPFADRRKRAAPLVPRDSRHPCGRPAPPPCLPVCCQRISPQPPAPTHPTRAALLPFAHFLTFFLCHTRVFMFYNIFSATQQRKALHFRAVLVNNSIS